MCWAQINVFVCVCVLCVCVVCVVCVCVRVRVRACVRKLHNDQSVERPKTQSQLGFGGSAFVKVVRY